MAFFAGNYNRLSLLHEIEIGYMYMCRFFFFIWNSSCRLKCWNSHYHSDGFDEWIRDFSRNIAYQINANHKWKIKLPNRLNNKFSKRKKEGVKLSISHMKWMINMCGRKGNEEEKCLCVQTDIGISIYNEKKKSLNLNVKQISSNLFTQKNVYFGWNLNENETEKKKRWA